MDGLRRSETRTSSDSYDQEETSSLQVTESVSTDWTDEKHSLYLKSMEASFVNQLYNSMDLLGWRSQNENLSDLKSSRQTHRNSRAASGQFKVLRDGCWQKVNFERSDSQLNKADESHGLLASPWIRHFRSAGKTHVAVSPSVRDSASSESQAIKLSGKKGMSCGSDTSSKHFDVSHSHLGHHDLVDSNTGAQQYFEVSDQNFLDEDIKGKKASSICSSRKMKTLIADASRSDQVVPHSKRPITEDVTEKCLSAARQRTCTSDWHSENVNGLSDGTF